MAMAVERVGDGVVERVDRDAVLSWDLSEN